MGYIQNTDHFQPNDDTQIVSGARDYKMIVGDVEKKVDPIVLAKNGDNSLGHTKMIWTNTLLSQQDKDRIIRLV